nr:hypothetical protein CFP56_68150 [Quercus suber]
MHPAMTTSDPASRNGDPKSPEEATQIPKHNVSLDPSTGYAWQTVRQMVHRLREVTVIGLEAMIGDVPFANTSWQGYDPLERFVTS